MRVPLPFSTELIPTNFKSSHKEFKWLLLPRRIFLCCEQSHMARPDPLLTADERWGFIFTSRNCFVFMFQIPCIFHQGSPEHSSSPLSWENSHTWDIWSVPWSNGLSWGRQGSSLLGTYNLLFLSWEVLPARITCTVPSFSPSVSRVN